MGPLRAFRDRYVAQYGGLSYDLAPGVVGVAPEHLAPVSDLAGRRVLVSPGTGASHTLSARPTFVVVSLSRIMRHALDAAGEGAVVFSTFDMDEPRVASLLASLDLGDDVFLNASVDRLPDTAVKRPFAS